MQSAGCPVFAPAASGPVRGVVHLLGGAFTGAAPAQAYGFLAATLARAGYTVIATPFGITFDHSAAAAAVTSAWAASLAQLRADPATAWAAPVGAPTHGVGHSMGAHLHALASALRLPGAGDGLGTPHASLTLLAYNNRPVAESIPVPMDGVRAAVEGFGGFAAAAAAAAGFDVGGGGGGGGRRDVPVPVGAAGASAAAPSTPSADSLIKAGIAALAAAGVPVDASTLAGLAPALDQFGGLADEVGAGTAEFSPTPATAKALIAGGYSVPRTLLVRFADDAIDETPELGAILRGINAAGTAVETLPGTHVTPCGPDVAVAGGGGGGRGGGDPPSLPSILGLLAAGGAAALQVDSRRLADKVVGFLDAQPVPRAALPSRESIF
jgi:hypothetical protein